MQKSVLRADNNVFIKCFSFKVVGVLCNKRFYLNANKAVSINFRKIWCKLLDDIICHLQYFRMRQPVW